MHPNSQDQYDHFLLPSKHEITSIFPKDNSVKMFQRKQQPRSLERKFYTSRREETSSLEKMCYLPSFFGSPEINKLLLSNGNGNLWGDSLSQTKQTTKKIERNLKHEKRSSPSQKNRKTEETKNMKSQKNREENGFKEEIERQRREIHELRQKNQLLNEEMLKIKYEHVGQLQSVECLNERIKKLNTITRESQRRIEDRNQEIRRLKKILQDQSKTINKLEEMLVKKEKQLIQLIDEKNEKEELEKILAEMSKDLNDIFVESKSPEADSMNQSSSSVEFDQEHLIRNLHERIKYQQIEINMLKRYKFQAQNYEKQVEKQKLQNKLLMNKLQAIPSGERAKSQQKSVESSLSFELSKDQIVNN